MPASSAEQPSTGLVTGIAERDSPMERPSRLRTLTLLTGLFLWELPAYCALYALESACGLLFKTGDLLGQVSLALLPRGIPRAYGEDLLWAKQLAWSIGAREETAPTESATGGKRRSS